MTNQPEIKQYRRKVSDERVRFITQETEVHSRDVRAVLEAEVEVRQGILQNVTGSAVPAGKKFFFANSHNGWGNKLLGERPDCDYYETLEQFQQEWEEVN